MGNDQQIDSGRTGRSAGPDYAAFRLKVQTLSLLLFVSFTSVLPALSFLESRRSLPAYFSPGNSPRNLVVSIASVNDAAGFDLGPERDDRRTEASELSVRLPCQVFLETGYSFYTWRASHLHPENVSRVDSLHVLAGGSRILNVWDGRLQMHLGAGFQLYGNLGGFFVQNTWHHFLRIKRPIPPANSCDSFKAAFLVSGEAEWESPQGWPVAAGLSFAASSLGQFELDGMLWGVLSGPLNYARAGMGGRYRYPGHAPSTVQKMFRDSSGWIFYAGFAVHGFFLRYSLQSGALVSLGTVGFRYSPVTRPNSDALLQGDVHMDYTVTYNFGQYFQHSVWSLEAVLPGRIGVVLDLHSGWLQHKRSNERFQKILSGVEWRYSFGEKTVLEPFGSLSLGPGFAQCADMDGFSAGRLVSSEWFFTTRFSAGFRVYPAPLVYGKRVVRYGIVLSGVLDLNTGGGKVCSGGAFIGLTVRDEKRDEESVNG